MSLKVEKLEHNMAKLTIEVPAEEFENAVNKAYLKNKNQISVQGFRKGKAPRAIVEKIYGPGVFYEDAANILIPEAYDKAMEEEEAKDLQVVSQPDIDVVQIEKGKSFIFTAEVALKPSVELGQYKGFDIEKKTAEVTEEDLAAELKRVQEQNSRTITVEDRPVQDGDIVNIDYKGFCDGEAFEGGEAQGHDLTIGSHSFIDTFEDQLIGKNIGDECQINVTFPEEYHAEELKGKPAMFEVKVNGIKAKELPELNDEFAEEVSDFDTLDEYKEDLKKKLAADKQTGLDNARQEEIIKKAVENATMDIPEQMVDFQARQMVNEYAQRLEMQGLSMDMYMKFTGQTAEQLQDSFKEQAKTRIENSLVLEAIADKEAVEVTEDDVKEEMEKIADQYKMEFSQVETLMTDADKESLKADLRIRKAIAVITE